MVLLGQTILSISQMFIIPLPPKLASVWFKTNEISTACCLGVFSYIGGIAVGYFLSPMLVHDSENMDDIGSGLKRLCWTLAGLMVPVTVGIIFYFPKEPPLPPSIIQAISRTKKDSFEKQSFMVCLKNMSRNKGFMLNLVAFSIAVGASSGLSTLLNQFILQYFVGATEEAGIMGFLMLLAGIISILLFGVIMDKTKKYKEISWTIYLLHAISVVCLMFSLKYQSKLLTYINCGLVGFFYNGYYAVGIEVAMKFTFPEEEVTMTGILMASAQLMSIIFTVALGYFNQWMGCFWSLAAIAVSLFLGTLVAVSVPNAMLRHEIFEEYNNEEKNIHH